MIKGIIFDLGGTLLDYAGPYDSWPALETPGFIAFHEYLLAAGIAMPERESLQEAGCAVLPEWWQAAMADKRNLKLTDMLAEALRQCGIEELPAALLQPAAIQYEDAICAQSAILPGTAETLALLKEQGYQIGLLSNTMFTGRAHIRDLKNFDLLHYFDALLFSADEALWKPQPKAFNWVLERLGIAAAEAVFVGDDPHGDMLGGQRAGLRTVHILSHNRFTLPDIYAPDAKIKELPELPPLLRKWVSEN